MVSEAWRFNNGGKFCRISWMCSTWVGQKCYPNCLSGVMAAAKYPCNPWSWAKTSVTCLVWIHCVMLPFLSFRIPIANSLYFLWLREWICESSKFWQGNHHGLGIDLAWQTRWHSAPLEIHTNCRIGGGAKIWSSDCLCLLSDCSDCNVERRFIVHLDGRACSVLVWWTYCTSIDETPFFVAPWKGLVHVHVALHGRCHSW